MAYSFVWSPTSKKELQNLQPKLSMRIIKKVLDLELAPYHFVEKLTDVNVWKLRVGDYRVILDIDEKKKVILVLKIGHRKNVYKK